MGRPAHRTPAMQTWVEINPLRRWRTDRGLTIATASQLLNVTTAALGHWETGVRLPSEVTYRRLRKHLPAELWETFPREALNTWYALRPEES